MLAFLCLIPAIVLQSWVVTILWSWFAVPLGAPHIGIVSAIGLSFIVSMFSSSVQSKAKDQTLLEEVLPHYLKPIIALGMAFIVHLFQI